MPEEASEVALSDDGADEKRGVLWDNDVTDTPEFYSNMAFVDETASDVTVLFGSFFKEDADFSHQVCKARVVMSHSSFLDFADRIAKEAQFLRKLYKLEHLPSLADVDEAAWNAAFEEVYGTDNKK